MFKSHRRRCKEEKERLPIAQRAAHGAGHVLNDLAANIWFSYLIIYLTKVVQLTNRHTGLVILLGQIADGIFTPFIGIICDRTVCRYGRRKVWHLIGTILVTVTFPLLLIHLLKDDTEDTQKVVYYVGVAAVFQFGWGCVQISHLSLIPEISRRKNERVELNAIRSAVTFLCGIYAYGATWILLGQSTEYKITPKVWKEFMYLSFIVVVTGNICNAVFHVVIKEPLSLAYLERLKRTTVDTKASVLSKPNLSIPTDNVFINHALDTKVSTSKQQLDIQILPQCNGCINTTAIKCLTIETGVTDVPRCSVTKDDCCATSKDVFEIIDRSPSACYKQKSRMDWLKSPGIYKNAVVYMCTRLVINISQSYLPLYLTETLNFEKEAIAYFPLVALISGVLASMMVKPLSKKVGQKITYIVGGAVSIGACVWFYFQPVSMRSAVYAATVFMGSGGSVMLVTSLSMIADLVGNDKECGAFIYGAISFTDKVSSGVVIAIIQELNPRDHQVESCLQCNEYVRHVQSIAPGAAAVVGLLTVIVFYNSKFVCRMRAEYSDACIQVSFDQPSSTEKEDNIDNATSTSSKEGKCSCHVDIPCCIAEVHRDHTNMNTVDKCDDLDYPNTTSSVEDRSCHKGTTDCSTQARCCQTKSHVNTDTRL